MSHGDRPPSRFDLDDVRDQLVQIKALGPPSGLLRKLQALDPSTADVTPRDVAEEIDRVLGMIDRMTPEERRDPGLIDDDRARTIAAEAGVEPSDVFTLIRQYEQMAKLIDQLRHAGPWRRLLTLLGVDSPLPRPAAEKPFQPATVRVLRIDGPRLSPRDRDELLQRWDTLARAGRAPRDASPWFFLWNRDLRLWDFTIEDESGRPVRNRSKE